MKWLATIWICHLFIFSFCDLCEEKQMTELAMEKIDKHLASPERIEHFREMATILARIIACTPHSADVNSM